MSKRSAKYKSSIGRLRSKVSAAARMSGSDYCVATVKVVRDRITDYQTWQGDIHGKIRRRFTSAEWVPLSSRDRIVFLRPEDISRSILSALVNANWTPESPEHPLRALAKIL
ncbi:MAG: hypothetical protein MN733_30275 [Nitrososphaera sp.]|nr:hypothetical protein [Nitrososphaera sp.]